MATYVEKRGCGPWWSSWGEDSVVLARQACVWGGGVAVAQFGVWRAAWCRVSSPGKSKTGVPGGMAHDSQY